jgi:hypothetical protein
MAFSLRVPSASARVPDVRMGVRPPLVRVPGGAVRVAAARPRAWTRRSSTRTSSSKPPPNCTNFTSGVVASY